MKRNKLIFVLPFYFLCFIQISFSQIVIHPCGGEDELLINEQTNLAQGKNTNQSSNYFVDGGFSSYAVDGITNVSIGTIPLARTNFEIQPWWEVDLGDSYFIRGVTIQYPSGNYTQGLNNFYILFSDVPFQSSTLNESIASEHVNHIYVSTAIPSGQEIQTYYQKAQYVRIQMASHSAVSFVEVMIPGGPGGGVNEICGNGIDDDYDCKVDCDDSECTPIIWAVNKKDPTCKICNDGWIEIKAYGDNLQYSIDGGQNFYSCQPVNQPNWCGFNHLPEGDYDIVVKNENCSTQWRGNSVNLRAPDGAPTLDNCDNGGFENGDNTGWTGTLGTNSNGAYVITNPSITTFNQESLQILSSGYVDPIINQSITAPIGNYFLRIGVPEIDLDPLTFASKGASARYCMEVNADNAMNQFYYFLVLYDGVGNISHVANPFFEWRIIDENDNIIQSLGKFTADNNSPLFSKYEVDHIHHDSVLYKDWSCQSLDLTPYIDQNICIEFLAVDCEPGTHCGYAFIDGFCSDDVSPYGEIVLDQKLLCIGRDQTLKIANAVRFDHYKIELSRVDNNGNLQGTTILSEAAGFTIPDIVNVIGTYLELNPGYTYSCEDKWLVKLTLTNACELIFETEESFIYNCVGYTFNYKDIIACLGNPVDIQMQGTTNCTGCHSYQWSIYSDPNTNQNSINTYLSDPLSQFPTILFSTNIYALGPTYLVEAITPEGCHLSDLVHTYSLPDFGEQIEVSLDVSPKDVCTFDAEAALKFSNPINSDLLDVKFYITANYGQSTPPGVVEELFGGILFSTPGENTEHKFRADIDHLLRGFDHQIRVVVRARGFDSPDVLQIGSCQFEETFNRESDSPFFGQVAVFIPNAFSPQLPGSSPDYFPSFEIIDGNGVVTHPNTVYEAWMSIWDRSSGGLVHEAHIVSTNNQPINPVDLAWDGKWNGQWFANSQVDVLVDYQNCQVAPSECFNNQDIIGPKLDFGDIGNGASIKPFHNIGLTTNLCTPDPLLCTPPTSIKNYTKCHKFHCSNNNDCHHIQVVQIAN